MLAINKEKKSNYKRLRLVAARKPLYALIIIIDAKPNCVGVWAIYQILMSAFELVYVERWFLALKRSSSKNWST